MYKTNKPFLKRLISYYFNKKTMGTYYSYFLFFVKLQTCIMIYFTRARYFIIFLVYIHSILIVHLLQLVSNL